MLLLQTQEFISQSVIIRWYSKQETTRWKTGYKDQKYMSIFPFFPLLTGPSYICIGVDRFEIKIKHSPNIQKEIIAYLKIIKEMNFYLT